MIAWLADQEPLAVVVLLYILFIWMLLVIVLADEVPKKRAERQRVAAEDQAIALTRDGAR